MTSNADSGSGTLREALTLAAANGSVDKDFIYFNLPGLSEAGRTITLSSRLPNVSSNLTIDASTQPGAVFGISAARVQLLTAFPMPADQIGLTLNNVNDVELYSLYIRNLTDHSSSYSRHYWQGISIKDCENIQIGAAGKGNVISGFFFDIGVDEHEEGGVAHYYCQNVVIQGNFVSIEPDGVTMSQLGALPLGLGQVYGQVKIGGTAEEGNLLAQGLAIGQLNVYDSTDPSDEISSLPATIWISNNKVGVNYSGTSGIEGSWGIMIATDIPGGKNNVTIEDNVISSSYTGITIDNNGWPVSIKRNFIGVDKTGTTRLPIQGIGILVSMSEPVMIGSDDPADANYIAYCKPVDIGQLSTVAVKKNSFFCTVNAYPMLYHEFIGAGRDITEVNILNITAGSVAGTATPNSSIELFYSDHCGTCSPETYFASTTSDAAGNWQYNGPVNGAVIASATHNNATSEFTRTLIDDSSVAIVPACFNTGSVKGAVPLSAAGVKWLDESGNVVGTSADLLNVPAGKYTLQALNGDCMAETTFEVPRALILDTSNLLNTNPSCSNANGSISGITATNNTSSETLYSWKDAGGTEVSRTADLNSIKAGSYTLTVSTADNSCSQVYGPVVLLNSTGPNIDQASVAITASVCGGSTGTITGMSATGTGTLSYIWTNQLGQQVAATRDLLNKPAGIYLLEVSDNSGCGSVSSSVITIPETNGIVITDAGIANPAVCGGNNGSISGITVTGASRYEWFDGQDRIVENANGPSLIDAAPGAYYMIASNASCSKKTRIYTIVSLPNTTDYGQPVLQLTNASCGMNNGSIRLTFNGPLPASYRWVDSMTGQTVGGNSSLLQGIGAGTYQLYVADQNRCEKLLGEYSISREPELLVDNRNTVIIADNCGLATGSITGLQASGKEPVNFSWTDAAGKILSASSDITNLKAGSYQLTITDAVGCKKTLSYSILNDSKVIQPPEVSDLQICSAGRALLWVNNVSEGYGYRLYSDAYSLVPLDDQSSGQFNIEVKEDRSFYVSRYSGNCESDRKEVMVSVGYTSIHLSNTFTPNNDGINDTWVIRGIENYPNASVQLFNRYGAKVYESQKYQTPFDGTNSGYPLPVGTYYYVIKMTPDCKPLSGSLTIFR
ncbi:gliding motility-associated C-terminal domain-containing protein [Flavihumibacter sp. R14]|nr:gliding motility-associated C-terminal domain-containing protein [Flavihumibacter soli]